MRKVRNFGRKNVAVLAAIAVSAVAATPLVMGASRALATPEEPGAVSATLPVEPVAVAPIAPARTAETCLRKVRVVYGGYGTPADGCAAR